MGIFSGIKKVLFVKLRVAKYRMLSTCKNVEGSAALYYPLLLNGQGKIIFGHNVQNGVINSPGYYEGYSYIEARGSGSMVKIGNNVAINNGFSAIAITTIIIEDNVLIGLNCSIIDNDGHNLDPEKRNSADVPSLPVHVKQNVFIGNNVTLLKGVTIGKDSVIASNSVVTKSIPDNVVAAGNPARVIRNII